MFEYSDLNHYYDIKRFKIDFIKHCPVKNHYEAYKIWAYWIIYNRSMWFQIDPFLPSAHIEQDAQLIKHLMEKGSTIRSAFEFYGTVMENAVKLTKCHYYLRLRVPSTLLLDPEVQHHRYSVVLAYQSIKHTLHQDQYQKIVDHYSGPPERLHYHLWSMLNNYYLLEGYSYQWAIPPVILRFLQGWLADMPLPAAMEGQGSSSPQRGLPLQTELFASPLNSFFPHYYSLFESDKLFGSRGNFFQVAPADLKKGGFQVNPPFIEALFIKTMNILLAALKMAAKDNCPLIFIFFMPDWMDSMAYKLAVENEFKRAEVVFEEHQHSYFDYKEGRRVAVHFATHMIILSSHPQLGTLSPSFITQLNNGFA